MKTVFLRVIEADDKATALLCAARESERPNDSCRFEVDPRSFANVPRSPFAYWVSNRLRGLFTELPSFGSAYGTTRHGMATADDFRFVRAWWAIPQEVGTATWFPFAKGGSFSPFYAPLHLVVNWGVNGEELKAWADPLYDNSGWSRIIQSTAFYFRPGLTWPLRTHRFCPQVLPAGVVISVRGSGIYAENPGWFLGLFSSRVVDHLMHMLSGKDAHPQFDMGDIAALPIPHVAKADRDEFESLARRGWSLTRFLDTNDEASHTFTLPALLQMNGETLDERAAAWVTGVRSRSSQLAVIQTRLDELGLHVYGIDEADSRAIMAVFGTSRSEDSATDGANDAVEDDAGQDSDENERALDTAGFAAELASWAVGVAFGCFDVRLATGARPTPIEPEPFDPLPACSPGMLAGDDGLPLAQPPANYPLAFPDTGVLVNDPGHTQDLTAAVRAVFDAVFRADAGRWWNDVAALLDPKGQDIRIWLAGNFFEHHIKRYSKSRRKAPIFWQFSIPSGRYSVWLYVHRLTRDSLFQLQTEVVGPKLAHEERRLTGLIQDAGGNPSASRRKEIAEQESFVEDLRTFREEVARVAPLWKPDLDDGVIINFAPLWRLVPHHRAWQKECKSCWDKLAGAEYDWAHLAMHLWPERVVSKCANDRSLAIAHGLEETFWVEGGDGKWQKRDVDQVTISRLITERSSPAVEFALKSLLDAPAPSTGRGGGKRTAAPRRAVASQRIARTGGQ